MSSFGSLTSGAAEPRVRHAAGKLVRVSIGEVCEPDRRTRLRYVRDGCAATRVLQSERNVGSIPSAKEKAWGLENDDARRIGCWISLPSVSREPGGRSVEPRDPAAARSIFAHPLGPRRGANSPRPTCRLSGPIPAAAALPGRSDGSLRGASASIRGPGRRLRSPLYTAPRPFCQDSRRSRKRNSSVSVRRQERHEQQRGVAYWRRPPNPAPIADTSRARLHA